MHKKFKNGFTLTELVIVIVLVSIVAAVVGVKWPKDSINLNAQASAVANDIRYAQSLAMTKGQRFRWVRASATTYQIVDNSGAAITLPLGGVTSTLNSGISFGAFTNLPNNLVAFDGRGIPYTNTATPGTALAATATIPLTNGSQTVNVTITQQTGRVTP